MTSAREQHYRHRPVTSDDATAILDVANTHSRQHYGDDRFGEREIRMWFGPDGKPQREDMEIWLADPCEPHAYAQLCDSEWPPTWDVWLDATVRSDAPDVAALWEDVLSWCERKTRALIEPRSPEAGHCCGARVLETDKPALDAYELRGFRRVRTETLMRVELAAESLLPPVWPDNIEVRPLDLALDLDEYARAYGEAFRDHWGHVELSPEELVRKKRAEFDSWGDFYTPELWFLAVEGNTIVGGVGTFLRHGGDPMRSYLYNVFVRREWRNRGIATALLRHSFLAAHARDARSAELHVDSENLTWALELYRGVGMEPVWHQHLYEKVLPPTEAW